MNNHDLFKYQSVWVWMLKISFKYGKGRNADFANTQTLSCGGDVGKVQWHGTVKVEMLVHILFAYIHFGFLGVYFWSIFSCPILTCAAESRSHFWYHYYWWKIVKMSPNISTLTKSKDRWIGTCSNKAKSSYIVSLSVNILLQRDICM